MLHLALSVDYRNNFIYPRFIEARGRGNRRIHFTQVLLYPIALFTTLYSILRWRTVDTVKMNPVSQSFCGQIYFYAFLHVCLKRGKSNMRMGTIKYLILYLLLLTGIKYLMFTYHLFQKSEVCLWAPIHHLEHFYAFIQDPQADHLNKFNQMMSNNS